MNRKERIFIGTHEISGWLNNLKWGFQENGYEVKTGVFQNHPFYDFSYDYDLSECRKHAILNQPIAPKNYFKRLRRKGVSLYSNLRHRAFIRDLIDDFDIFIFLWGPLTNDFVDYKWIKEKGKKLVVLFVGSDVRYIHAFQQEFDVSQWIFPEWMQNEDINDKLKKIRFAEKYADVIYSLPDQAGLQLRPYLHLQVPVLEEKTNTKRSVNTKPLIIHAPSDPYKKGSDIIEKTLDELVSEGLEFEFKSVRNLPHSKILRLLSEADILVDQIVFHGPATLAFEAMIRGCVVATRFIENACPKFLPPVWPIDAQNIKERLRELIRNRELRGRMIKEGQEYVRRNNLADIVANTIMDDLHNQSNADYKPSFLDSKYRFKSKKDKLLTEKWNVFVCGCDWYQDLSGKNISLKSKADK